MENTEIIDEKKIIKNKNFLLILFGGSTSKFGTILYEVVLAWWLVEKTGNAQYLGLISAASMLPVLILNLFSGVLVDIFDRRKIMIMMDIISGIACIMVGVVVLNNELNLPVLIFCAIMLGASSSMFSPASRAILPELVEKDNLTKANSVLNVFSQTIGILAPLAAGLYIKNMGYFMAGIFFFNGISFFISSISEMLIKYDFQKKDTIVDFNRIKSNLISGLNYVKEEKWLFKLLIVSACVNFFIAAYNIVTPLFLILKYNDDGSLYAMSLTVFSIFGILGGVSVIKGKAIENVVQIKKELAFSGIGILMMQIVDYRVMLAGVALFAFFLTRYNIKMFSIVQSKVDKAMLGRVFSIIFTVALALAPIGNLFFGYLGNQYINYVYIFAGIGIIASTFLISSD